MEIGSASNTGQPEQETGGFDAAWRHNSVRQTLTDRAVQSLRPAASGKRYMALDALVPGLAVRVTDKGTRTYVLTTRYPGSSNPTRRALGEVGELGLAEARQKAREWLSQIGMGVDPTAEARRARGRTGAPGKHVRAGS